MTLDGKYFNNLELDAIDDKYYDADEVDRILFDIRKRAELQCEEISNLKKQLQENEKASIDLKELENQKTEIGSAVIAARCAYKSIVDKANEKAEEIISRAEKTANESDKSTAGDAEKYEEFYISRIEKMISRMKSRNKLAEAEINEEWKRFLVSLIDESQEAEPVTQEIKEDSSEVSEESVRSKISKIAKELSEIK